MKINYLLIFILLGLSIVSCSDDEEPIEEMEEMEECETTGVTYTNGASSIIDASCALAGCHGEGTTSTFPMSNYDETFTAVGFGRIVGAINHSDGFLAMPRPVGSDKLSDCNIDILTAWIDDGAPE